MKAKSNTPAILRPIESLISKSEKALQKLTAGTWQHTKIRDDLRALDIAMAVAQAEGVQSREFSKIELQCAISSLNLLITRCEDAQNRLADGTAQYSLLVNRVAALSEAVKVLHTAQGCHIEDKTKQNEETEQGGDGDAEEVV